VLEGRDGDPSRPCIGNDGKPALFLYGLPRFWKDPPPLTDSRSFLLSWLSGYFAADGSVSPGGQPTIESADRSALDLVRSIAAICGVGYSSVQHRKRQGFGPGPTSLYRMSLRAADLPSWFFHIASHRERAAVERKRVDRAWLVESVAPLGVSEEVFCAIVPGAQAFGLTEDLMTGNCPSTKPHEIIELVLKHPELAWQIVEMERVAGPGLDVIDGLWGEGTKGTRGGVPKPGSMAEFILCWMIDGRAYGRLPRSGDKGIVDAEVRALPSIGRVFRLPMLGEPDRDELAALADRGRAAAEVLRARFEALHGPVDDFLALGRARAARRTERKTAKRVAKRDAGRAAKAAAKAN
jgi:hypothetical protein